MNYFNEAYYIQSKLAHMDSIGQPMDEYALRAAIRNAGLTVQEHYETYGREEGLNPNPYFNEKEYLQAKANQLNSTGELANPAGGPWDADAVLKAINDAGMNPAEHYDRYGAFEKDADGNFINPSNAFDANAYWSAKLCELQTKNPDDNWTLPTMLAAFQDADVSPVSHYMLWGADEANATGIAFVQTVPQSMRVPNDPARDVITGDIVPGNYMPATPAPTDTNASAAGYPADVGGLADPKVSPPPVYPESSLPVPGDEDYYPLPSTIKPEPGTIIMPPSATESTVGGNWLVVDTATGTTTVVDRNGAILGQTDADITNEDDGSLIITLPDADAPTSDLPPLKPSDLPPWIEPDPDLPNHFPDPTPDPDPTPSSYITPTVAGTTLTLSGPATGAVWVSFDASGRATVTDGSLYVTNINPNIKTVDVSGVTGHDVTFAPANPATTLSVDVVGQTGARTTTINGGSGADSVGLKANYAGTVALGEGDDTLTVLGTMGAATLNGGAGNDKILVSGDADIRDVASLINFGAIHFTAGASGSLTLKDTQLNGISISGTKGNDAQALHISMTDGHTLDLNDYAFTDWNSEDRVTITTCAAGGDTITLRQGSSETVKFSASGTPAANTVNGFDFGSTDAIAISGVSGVKDLLRVNYQKMAASDSLLWAHTVLVVYTDKVDDKAAARNIVQSLQGTVEGLHFYFLSSDDANATLYKATYTSSTEATLEEISTLTGATVDNLRGMSENNFDGLNLNTTDEKVQAAVSGKSIIVTGEAGKVSADTLSVYIGASGEATVLDHRASTQHGIRVATDENNSNSGIEHVNVAGVTGVKTLIMSNARDSSTPLNVRVTGQSNSLITDVNGKAGDDIITVLSGNVNVDGAGGNDTITLGTGQHTVSFEPQASDNGLDEISGFKAEPNGDKLHFFGSSKDDLFTPTAKTDRFGDILTLSSSPGNDNMYYKENDVIRLITADGTLSADNVATNPMTPGKLSLSDNAWIVALVANDQDAQEFNVYEVKDMNEAGDITDLRVTLMGTVTAASGNFGSLTGDNICIDINI